MTIEVTLMEYPHNWGEPLEAPDIAFWGEQRAILGEDLYCGLMREIRHDVGIEEDSFNLKHGFMWGRYDDHL